MNLKSVCATVTAAIALLMPQAVFMQKTAIAGEFIVKAGPGLINWSAGYLEATGTATIPAQNMGRISARPAAVHNARVEAGRNLLELTKNIAVDSMTTVGMLMTENDIINIQVEGLIKKAAQTGLLYLPGGAVEVKLRLPLYGELSQIVTPSGIEKRIAAASATAVASVSKTSASPDGAETAGRFATGLVIDARGFEFRPAIWPHLYDEKGREIYGFSARSHECSTDRGACGYSRDSVIPGRNERAGENPIIIRTIGTGPAGGSDLVIANDDAFRLLSLEAENHFLKNCRVLILLD